MYSHCMFCQSGLGANQEVEHFPVGRRLVYDQARGRLWVVCPRCHRWNLTPLEERWEAVEECERAFRASRLRASTENIAIARTASRMDLVRVGEPLRREMAFWRWGDRFGARRKKALVWGGIGATAATVAAVGTLATGGAAFAVLSTAVNFSGIVRRTRRHGLVRVETDSGSTISAENIGDTRWGEPDPSGTPSLVMHHHDYLREVIVTGERAVRAAAVIVSRLNHRGAKDGVVRGAADAIEAAGGPEGYVAATWGDTSVVRSPLRRAARPGRLGWLPLPTRVALEMALHEEEERRALGGELAGLEAMWRAAEEIAEISDNLLVPLGWEAFKRRHTAEKEEQEGGAGEIRKDEVE